MDGDPKPLDDQQLQPKRQRPVHPEMRGIPPADKDREKVGDGDKDKSVELSPTPPQKAMALLDQLRKQLVDRVVAMIIENEDLITNGDLEEGYSYWLQELDEKYLAKINIVRRAMGELQTLPGLAASVVSKVRHIHVEPSMPLGPTLLGNIETLGSATIVDLVVQPDIHGGYDVFIVYQQLARGPKKDTTKKRTLGQGPLPPAGGFPPPPSGPSTPPSGPQAGPETPPAS